MKNLAQLESIIKADSDKYKHYKKIYFSDLAIENYDLAHQSDLVQ